ncbi:hypothetical protein ACXHXM_34095
MADRHDELFVHYFKLAQGNPIDALSLAIDDLIKMGGLVSAGYVRVNKDGKNVRK